MQAGFILDDRQILRAIFDDPYPMIPGQNMNEILRLVDAHWVNAKHQVALPANWRPDDRVIVPTPKTVDEARARLEDRSLEVFDRYLAKKTR
ncbi:hypothetical protein AB1399_09530 [Hydrogenibacillus schlegelii]